jgi:hypothetical protein
LERPSWAPDEVNLDRPSVARVYDYYLGGSHNFAADRAFAEQVLQHMPEVTAVAQSNRAFLRRAVRYLCEAGIKQFIDLGSGIPTVGNVHEIAHGYDEAIRVVYVDNDPVAVAHSRTMLAETPNTIVVNADLRKPADVLADANLRKLVTFTEPIAVLLVSVLHFVSDEEEPANIVAGYLAPAVPGSFVVISAGGRDHEFNEREDQVLQTYRRSPTPVYIRYQSEITAFFDGLTVVEPGVVKPDDWRPDPGDEDLISAMTGGRARMFAAIGRKD